MAMFQKHFVGMFAQARDEGAGFAGRVLQAERRIEHQEGAVGVFQGGEGAAGLEVGVGQDIPDRAQFCLFAYKLTTSSVEGMEVPSIFLAFFRKLERILHTENRPTIDI